MTLPYNLTKDELVLDPVTERAMTDGTLELDLVIEEFTRFARENQDAAMRVQNAAMHLFIALRPKYASYDGNAPLYAACLDTALIWELG